MLVLKRIALSLLFALVLSVPVSAGDCSAAGWIVYHPDSGTILAGKEPDTPLPMASTTKIMTALLTLENCLLDDVVIIEKDCTDIEGSSLYLREGEKYSVEELLLGLLLSSGNDASLALSKAAAPTTEMFVAAMNEKAAELGMAHTHFINPHGLPAEGHVSTARDLALLMGEAMKNPVFRRLVGTKTAEVHGVTLQNHNKLLWQCEGVNGGKTGYTRAAGRCLVSSCCRNGMELICVTLNDRRDWEDHSALYDEAFASWQEISIDCGMKLGSAAVIGSDDAAVCAGEKCILCVPKKSELSVEIHVPKIIFGPVPTGEKAGEALLRWTGGEKRIPLLWAAK